MVSTPWFYTAFRTCISCRKIIQSLEYYFYRDMVFIFTKNDFTEIIFKIFTDYEYYLTESATDSIEDRIIHDCFSTRTKSVKLLKATVTAPIPAANTNNVGFISYIKLYLKVSHCKDKDLLLIIYFLNKLYSIIVIFLVYSQA